MAERCYVASASPPAALRAAAAEALAEARALLGVEPELLWIAEARAPRQRLEARMEELIWRLGYRADVVHAPRRGIVDDRALSGLAMPLARGPQRIYVLAEPGGPAEIRHRVLHECAHLAWPGATENEVETWTQQHCGRCMHCIQRHNTTGGAHPWP